MKIINDLNLNGNQIINGTAEIVSNLPSTDLNEGRLVYHSVDKCYYYYNGTEWKAGSGFESSLKLVEAQPYESPEVI